MQHGVEEAHGSCGQAGGVHGSVRDIEMNRCHVEKVNLAELRESVSLDQAAVASDRRGPPTARCQTVHPLAEVGVRRQLPVGAKEAIARVIDDLEARTLGLPLGREAATFDLAALPTQALDIDHQGPRASVWITLDASAVVHSARLRMVTKGSREAGCEAAGTLARQSTAHVVTRRTFSA